MPRMKWFFNVFRKKRKDSSAKPVTEQLAEDYGIVVGQSRRRINHDHNHDHNQGGLITSDGYGGNLSNREGEGDGDGRSKFSMRSSSYADEEEESTMSTVHNENHSFKKSKDERGGRSKGGSSRRKGWTTSVLKDVEDEQYYDEPSIKSCDVSVLLGTWNVGNEQPPADLAPWLPRDCNHHIVAIGAQECKYTAPSDYKEDGEHHHFVANLLQNLGESRYTHLKTMSCGQIRLAVFVRTDFKENISDVVDGSSAATGVGGVLANKGGVGISLKVYDTSLCFVNSHFAAHAGETKARNDDYREIVKQLRLGLKTMDIMNQFHHLFWLGDLNYRLDYPPVEGKGKPAKTPSKDDYDAIMEKIKLKSYGDLLATDELYSEKEARRTLLDFKEDQINFPPTFKMIHGSDGEYNDLRTPAWCDRILWRSLEGFYAHPRKYYSVPEVKTSDHTPVGAVFSLKAYSASVGSMSGPRYKIKFSSLSAVNLKKKDLLGLSDPYVKFVGDNLQTSQQTDACLNTLDPIWVPKDLPKLSLKTQMLSELAKEFLFVKVIDSDFMEDDTLAQGVISLAEAVAAFNASRGSVSASVPFSIKLTYGGIDRGQLEGSMELYEAHKARSFFKLPMFKLAWQKAVERKRRDSSGG